MTRKKKKNQNEKGVFYNTISLKYGFIVFLHYSLSFDPHEERNTVLGCVDGSRFLSDLDVRIVNKKAQRPTKTMLRACFYAGV